MKDYHLPQAPARLSLRDALRVRSAAYPWNRAIGSGLATCLPILIGFLLGDIIHGFSAALGAFTFLYIGAETYKQRAKKLAAVAICLAAAMVLGSLLAPYTILLSVVAGIIGVIAFYVLNTLQLLIPGPVFFVLIFCMATGLPLDPQSAWERGFYVLLGGALSWLLAMSSWLWTKRNHEKQMLIKSYRQLLAMLQSIGSPSFYQMQHLTILTLKQADRIIYAAKRQPATLRLHEQAADIFQTLTQLKNNDLPRDIRKPLEDQLSAIIDALEDAKGNWPAYAASELPLLKTLQSELEQAYNIASQRQIEEPIQVETESAWNVLRNGISRTNIAVRHALFYGLFIMIASLLAHGLGFNRPYWVPITCAAVLIGANMTLTIHRAIQRSLGTIVGTLIGGLILSLEPSGFYLILVVGLLQLCVELVIVRNYVFANMFIAPLVLVLVETMNPGNTVSYFVTARVMDTIVGSVIAILAVLLLWRSIHSRFVPIILKETILHMQELLRAIHSGEQEKKHTKKLMNNLIELRAAYERSLGDLSASQQRAEILWPAIMHAQHAGYLLMSLRKQKDMLTESRYDAIQNQLGVIMTCLTTRQPVSFERYDELDVQQELNQLQSALAQLYTRNDAAKLVPN
ncbi:FUSC family protein [Terribacillus sp. 179-K 1B1 HS]|uniref:FUSC family protein n=1 Tax=Terribacillus sp. 179-K 1B1 HS TaxID=3142388 RepID=UPI0039A23CCC